MPDNQITGEPGANGPDGWTVIDPEVYQFVASHDPPRTGSFLLALKSDARSWQVIKYWAAGLFLVAFGVASVCVGVTVVWPGMFVFILAFAGFFATIIGARLLSLMLRLFCVSVRKLRRGPVLRGEIHSLGPHPLAHDYSVADAQLPDGRSVLVGVKTAPVAGLLERGPPAEVLLLADPDERMGVVIAIRAMRRDREETETSPRNA